MYTRENFKTKKALRAAMKEGRPIELWQPGPFANPRTPINGHVAVEGPHYPEPHRWYASGVAHNSVLTALDN